MEHIIREIEDILEEGGMEGLHYQPQEAEINEVGEGMGMLARYIESLEQVIHDSIDDPLYQGFMKSANDVLSHISMKGYTTENTLGVKRQFQRPNGENSFETYEKEMPTISLEDFIGLKKFGEDLEEGKVVGATKEIKAFTDLFGEDFEKQKIEMAGSLDGEDTLEQYLGLLSIQGEFDNKIDKPFLEFISCLADCTIVVPLYEACTGENFFTKEKLSDFERGMKFTFAVIDAITLFSGIKASGVVKLLSKSSLKVAGKMVLTDMVANGVAYQVGSVADEMGLPLPITMLCSVGAGVSVSKVAGKYVFKNGNKVILEANAEQVDAMGKIRKVELPDETARYHKYWENVNSGRYDIPYGMTDMEYEQFLKGIGKVDEAVKIKYIDYE